MEILSVLVIEDWNHQCVWYSLSKICMKEKKSWWSLQLIARFRQIYLLLLLPVTFLLWLVLVAVDRLNKICLRRINKGVVRDEGFGEERIGIVVLSSRAELRRRLWFDETHETQVDDIPPRRRRFFVDFVNVVIAIEDDVVTGVVVVFVFIFWWFWINAVERGRDEILGVELFRRV
jgi:hypothetical protein